MPTFRIQSRNSYLRRPEAHHYLLCRVNIDSAYREYVITCKRSIKLPRGRVNSGTRDHMTWALVMRIITVFLFALQLSKRPLTSVEFVAPLARIDPIYKEEEEAFKVIQIIPAISSPLPRAFLAFFPSLIANKKREKETLTLIISCTVPIHLSQKKIYCNYFCDF